MRLPALPCFVLAAALCGCSPVPQGVEAPAAAVPATSFLPRPGTGRIAQLRQPSRTVGLTAAGPSALATTASIRVQEASRPKPPAALALVTRPVPGEADVPVAEPGGVGPLVSVQLADPDAAGAPPGHLLVWEFELRGPDGELVPSQVLAGGAAESGRVALINDPDLAEGSLVLVPLVPLEPGATYTAYFTARRAGAGEPVTRAWPFTTAEG